MPWPHDIDKAATWLKKSAEQDYGDGQFAYGVLLAKGRGKGQEKATEADKAEALDWLEKAEANGKRRGRRLRQAARRHEGPTAWPMPATRTEN